VTEDRDRDLKSIKRWVTFAGCVLLAVVLFWLLRVGSVIWQEVRTELDASASTVNAVRRNATSRAVKRTRQVEAQTRQARWTAVMVVTRKAGMTATAEVWLTPKPKLMDKQGK